MERMDLVAAIPLFAMRTLRMGRLPPRFLTYSSTVCASEEEDDDDADEDVLSRVAAQREVSILAMFDGLTTETTSLFWKKALLMVPNTLLEGVIVLGVNADC